MKKTLQLFETFLCFLQIYACCIKITFLKPIQSRQSFCLGKIILVQFRFFHQFFGHFTKFSFESN